MKLGYSILLQDYVTAEEVGYEDCREFQIVCPICYEAIFKAGSAETKRQYLSHYERTASNVDDCENRVAQMLSRADYAATVAISRGQQLELFHSVFREALADAIFQDDKRAYADGIIDKIMSRPRLREMAVILRDCIREDGSYLEDKLWPTMDDLLVKAKMFSERKKIGFAQDMLRHLVSPNNFKNFYFCMCAGLIIEGSDRGSGKHKGIVTTLILSTDRQLRAELNKLSDDEWKWLYHELVSWTAIALMQFPYFNVLRSENTKRLTKRAA